MSYLSEAVRIIAAESEGKIMNGIFEEIDAKMATHEPTDYAQQIAELRQCIGQLQQVCLDIQCRLLKHFNDGHGPAQ